jgi:DtxR family Mn-dependent transcriptional regulator
VLQIEKMTTKRNERVAAEDVLKYLHECEYEGRSRAATFESVAGALGIGPERTAALLDRMRDAGLARWNGETAELTGSGRRYARQVIRAHRLYETYLAHLTGEPPAAWHRRADLAEHGISEAEADRLADRLGHPRFDPHGDPIPTKRGELPELRGESLDRFSEGDSVRVLHVGDEPPVLGKRLAETGIGPGMRIEVGTSGETRVSIRVEGRPLELDRALAGLVRVAPLEPGEERLPAAAARLGALPEGREARVVGLLPSCVGTERTRLLDLGFVPGSRVRAEMASPLGSPKAYRLRGALVALRPRQADLVVVEPDPAP